MEIRPYLTFQGTCEEAINLYLKAFPQAKLLEMMRFSDMPAQPGVSEPLPEHFRQQVLQATIQFGERFIRLSDCGGELNDPESERLSLAVECSVTEVRHAFNVLAESGRIGIPLQETFFSPCHGVVFDKFGVMWNFVGQSES